MLFRSRRIAGLSAFATELERHGAWANVLSAATQFRLGGIPPGASSELVDEILARAARSTAHEPLARRVPLPDLGTHLGFALLALFVFMMAALLGPGRIVQATAILLDPGLLRSTIPDSGIYVTSGDLQVPPGDMVMLSARDFTGGGEPAVVEIDRTGGLWQPTEIDAGRIVDTGVWREMEFEVGVVEDPFRYRFRRGTVTSKARTVSIRERPVVTHVRLELSPPAYSSRPVRTIENPAGAVGSATERHGHRQTQRQATQHLPQEIGRAHV